MTAADTDHAGRMIESAEISYSAMRRLMWYDSAHNRVQRHIVAGNDHQGIVIILSGPSRELELVENDLRFLRARLERP